jgi:CBS domain containing-hemolysin-like protein
MTALVVGRRTGDLVLCSVLEAVLLSLTHSYVGVLEERGERAGALLARMRERIDEPIAAILTLNTIAHTVSAAIGGAMALRVFGSQWIAAVLGGADAGDPAAVGDRAEDAGRHVLAGSWRRRRRTRCGS